MIEDTKRKGPVIKKQEEAETNLKKDKMQAATSITRWHSSNAFVISFLSVAFSFPPSLFFIHHY